MTSAALTARRPRAASRTLTAAVPPTVAISFVVLAVVLAWALAPALFAGGDPASGVPDDKFLAPSLTHLFGTDHLGRDILSMVMVGARNSIAVAHSTSSFSAAAKVRSSSPTPFPVRSGSCRMPCANGSWSRNRRAPRTVRR